MNFYEQNAKKLFAQYESADFKKIHEHLLPFLPKQPANILDVGSGSGRDAVGMAKMGYCVWAVEPSKAMLELAITHHNTQAVNWVQDALPELKAIFSLDLKFDFILISAVWSHLELKDQNQSIINLSRLLNIKGRISISLRMQPFLDQRISYAVNSHELIAQAKELGLELIEAKLVSDKLNRSDISWETLLFEKK